MPCGITLKSDNNCLAETTTVPTIIITFYSVNLSIAKSISNQIGGSITVTMAFCAVICIDIGTTTITSIKEAGSIIVFVIAVPISMQFWIGTTWNNEITLSRLGLILV